MGGGRVDGEILRQYLDHGGWYELKDTTFHNIEDMMYVAAMGARLAEGAALLYL